MQWSRGEHGEDRCTTFCYLICGGGSVMTSAKFIINRLAKEICVAPKMARSERESTVDRATQISSVDKISKLGLPTLFPKSAILDDRAAITDRSIIYAGEQQQWKSTMS